MRVLEQLATTVADLLREDSRRVLLGEDVRDGGMLGLSSAVIADESLRERIAPTPLGPATMWAHAAGVALGGRRPIVLSPTASALLEGFAGLREAALASWRSGDQRAVPLLVVAPVGPGFGLGTEHASVPEGLLVSVPGLRVVVAGSTNELAAYLRAAANFEAGEEPTVLLLPRTLLLRDTEPGWSDELGHAFGSAHVRRHGDAATVLTWGSTVELVDDAVVGSEVDATVVDVSTLSPLDTATIVEAVNNTGKLVIVHAGAAGYGVGAELAARVADRSIYHLDAPILRVTGEAGPYAPGEEQRALPSPAAIVEAIRTVASH